MAVQQNTQKAVKTYGDDAQIDHVLGGLIELSFI